MKCWSYACKQYMHGSNMLLRQLTLVQLSCLSSKHWPFLSNQIGRNIIPLKLLGVAAKLILTLGVLCKLTLEGSGL